MSDRIKTVSAGVVLGATAAVVLVGAFVAGGDWADAKPRIVVKPNGSCTCVCSSDERMDTFGRPPRYRQEISGPVEYTSDCDAQNGGGCRIRLDNGSYVPGTSTHCRYQSYSGAAANTGTGGVDPTGGNGPTQPFSRPGIIFQRNP